MLLLFYFFFSKSSGKSSSNRKKKKKLIKYTPNILAIGALCILWVKTEHLPKIFLIVNIIFFFYKEMESTNKLNVQYWSR